MPTINRKKITRKLTSKHRREWIGLGVITAMVVAVFISVNQLDTIREFFSQASGSPANIHVNTQGILGPMPRPWRNLAQGGEAHDWRLKPLQGSVAALEPEYIRIDHIYDFYDIVQGTPGNLSFDFSKLDVILDDIQATGAKPFIALSYMPPAISSGDIVAPPKNWSDWQTTVRRTIEHVSGTRGISDVYYEVWNEPDLFGNWKYYGDRNYLTMYHYAALGAQQARTSQPFKIGGPGITALYKNWYNALLEYTLANNLRIDFFSWHRYDYDIEIFRKDMIEAQTWVAQHPQYEATLEFLITEWGPDSENAAVYDGRFSAAHTVAGAIEMIPIVDRAFVFEIQDGPSPTGEEYWGRWGMFTAKEAGAKAKSRYWGLRMLDSVGDQRLELKGKGYWVKALAGINEAGEPIVILANYDRLSKHAETVPVTFENINPGNYTVETQLLGGSAQTQAVATTEAQLRVDLAMPVNSVGKVTLKRGQAGIE